MNFPNELALVVPGICLAGVAVSFVFVPLLSEIIKAVKEKEGLTDDNQMLNDKASGIFNTAYAIGCTIGPVLGGILNDSVGFRYTCDTMSMSSLTFAVLYFLFVVLPALLTKEKSKPEVLLVKDDELSIISESDELIQNSQTHLTIGNKVASEDMSG
jgi:MFS family permease